MSHPSGPASAPGATRPGRRSILQWLTYGTSGLAAALLGVPFIGYLLGPLRKYRSQWVPLGPSASFPLEETRLVTFDNPLGGPWDGMAAHMGVYVRKQSADQFLILAMNCAHLGCPVTWFPQSGLFMCPCHGGVYYENGDRASGPPPRGLFVCLWRVRGGELQIMAPHLPTLQNTLDQNGSA